MHRSSRLLHLPLAGVLLSLLACGEPIVGGALPRSDESPGPDDGPDDGPDAGGPNTPDTGTPTQDPLARFAIAEDLLLELDEDTSLTVEALEAIADGARFDAATVTVEIDAGDAVTADGFSFARNGSTASVTITPVADASGDVEATLVVREGGRVVLERAFRVRVLPVNDAPVLGTIDDQTTDKGVAIADLSVMVSDIDNDLASLTLSVVAEDPALATYAVTGTGNTRTIEITPAAGAVGSTTVTVTLSDGDASVTGTFMLEVLETDDPPTITPIGDQTLLEDGSTGPLSVTIDDDETALTDLVVTASSDNTTLLPAAGVVLGGSGGSRTIELTPAANASGTATVTVTVADAMYTTTTTFGVTVTAVDDPPTLSAITAPAPFPEDGNSGALAFTVADIDTPLASLTLAGASDNGALTDNASFAFGGSGASRTVVVTPLADESGTATVTISVSDGTSTATTTFGLDVTPVDDAPEFVVTVPAQTTPEDTPIGPLSFTVTDRDTAPGALVIAGSSDGGPIDNAGVATTTGTLTPTVTLTPLLNQLGISNITLSVSDGTSTVTDTFQVTVQGVDDPPRFTATIADQAIDEDTGTGALTFSIEDPDSSPPNLTVTATSGGGPVSNTGLSVSAINLAGGAASPTVTVTPDSNASGVSTVTLTLSDGNTTVTDTFLVTVNAVDDPPVIEVSPGALVTDEDTDTAPVGFTILDVDSAPPALTLGTAVCNPPCSAISFSSIAQDGAGRAMPTLIVTPEPNGAGTTTVTISLSDGSQTVSDSFSFTVNPVNDAPILGAISGQTTLEDTASTPVSFAVNDADDAACTLLLDITSSDNPSLADAGDVTFDQTNCAAPTISVLPKPNQSGSVNLTVRVRDGAGLSDSQTFTLNVTAVDDPPTISAIGNQIISEDGNTGDLGFVVSDIDTAVGALVVTASSDNTALVANSGANLVLAGTNPNRTIRVVPLADAFGTAQITVQVTDGTTPVTTTFSVDVNAVDDPPTISVSIADQTIDENTSTGALAFTVNDIDTALGTLSLSGSSTDTALLPEPAAYAFGGSGTARTVTLTPAANGVGTATVTLSVADATTTVTASSTFLLTVNSVNAAPVANDDTFLGGAGTTGNQHKAFSASVLANDTDDGPILSLTATAVSGGATSQGGSFDLLADGTFTYYPPAGFLGTDSFDYTLNDNDASGAKTDTGTVFIAVGAPMVWFVDNTAAGGGDGRSHAPFNTLASVNGVTVATADDQVRLAYGDGTSAQQNSGVLLQPGMDLVGIPSGGFPPVIGNSTGSAITLSSNNTISNIEIGSAAQHGITGSNVAGATVITAVDISNIGSNGISIGGSVAGATVALSDLTISTGTGAGIVLNSVGTVSATGTISVAAIGGLGLDLDTCVIDGTNGFDLDSVTVNNPSGGGIRISGNTGGTVTFGDLAATANGAAGIGVDIINNPTTTVRLTGSTNTVSATGSAALRAINTALDLTFRSLSATGGANGIDLSATTGTVVVTGDGTAAENGSGGTLNVNTDSSVKLANAGSVTLNRMRLTNATNDGIRASGTTSLSMAYARIQNAGADTSDHGIDLSDVTGSVSLSNLEIDSAFGDGIRLTQNSGTISSFTLQNSNLHDSVSFTAMSMEVNNAAAITGMTISNNTFSAVTRSLGLTLRDTAAATFSFTGNTLSNHASHGLDLVIVSGAPSLTFTVNNNSMGTLTGGGVRVLAGTATTGTLRGLIDNNTLGTAGVLNSGGRGAFGVDLRGSVDSIIEITNNTVHDYGNENGLFVITGEGLPLSGTTHFYIANNDIRTVSGANFFEPFAFYINDSLAACLNLRNNNGAATGAFAHYLLYEGLFGVVGNIFLDGFSVNAQTTLTNNGNTSAGGAPVVDTIGTITSGTCSRLP